MYQSLYPLVRQFGSQSLSISTLQPSCRQFVLDEGYIAYYSPRKSNKVFALGDPVCAPESTHSLLCEFLRTFPKATFTQISEGTASHLKTFGYRINTFGEEHALDPTSTPLTWGSHKSLKRESNKALRQGLIVNQLTFAELSQHNFELISQQWRQTRKNKHPQQFLTRPLPTQEEPDTLYFGAFDGNTLVGFSILSPMYTHDTVSGYYADITRYLPHYSACLYLLHFNILNNLKKKNISHLSLGVSCYDVAPEHQRYSHPLIKYLIKMVMMFGNRLYAFKHLHRFKLRFHGTKTPCFFATHSPLPILYLLQLFLITTRVKKS